MGRCPAPARHKGRSKPVTDGSLKGGDGMLKTLANSLASWSQGIVCPSPEVSLGASHRKLAKLPAWGLTISGQ